MFSNKYIFIYATILVVVVAAILSVTAVVLQPFQDRNVNIEKIQNILTSANITSTKSDAEELYGMKIKQELVVDLNGDVVGIYADGKQELGNIRAFDLDLKSQLKLKEEVEAGKSKETPVFPIFVCDNNGENTYIIPLLGKGLWGPIWGYVALKNDFKTIVGAVFDHKGETPGLGAEINTPKFQEQFIGKTIFDDNGNFTSVTLVKGGLANSNMDPKHGVDAISGGTLTSNGVSDMLQNCLLNYLNYFKKQLENAPNTDMLPDENSVAVADSLAKVEAQERANAEAQSKAAEAARKAKEAKQAKNDSVNPKDQGFPF